MVSSFSELVSTGFSGMQNAVCWQRNPRGNFKEIAEKLQLKENVTEISQQDLLTLKVSDDGAKAREIILNDLALLTKSGAQPVLNLIKNYERDDAFDFISTDVYSYHVDRSPVATSTFLCTYDGAAGDIIGNDEATQKILIPEIRENLKKLHQGCADDFETFLTENYFDLHFEAKPNAKPFNLGTRNLWKLSVDHPGQKVLPCIHRAPVENEGQYRLLLIC